MSEDGDPVVTLRLPRQPLGRPRIPRPRESPPVRAIDEWWSVRGWRSGRLGRVCGGRGRQHCRAVAPGGCGRSVGPPRAGRGGCPGSAVGGSTGLLSGDAGRVGAMSVVRFAPRRPVDVAVVLLSWSRRHARWPAASSSWGSGTTSGCAPMVDDWYERPNTAPPVACCPCPDGPLRIRTGGRAGLLRVLWCPFAHSPRQQAAAALFRRAAAVVTGRSRRAARTVRDTVRGRVVRRPRSGRKVGGRTASFPRSAPSAAPGWIRAPATGTCGRVIGVQVGGGHQLRLRGSVSHGGRHGRHRRRPFGGCSVERAGDPLGPCRHARRPSPREAEAEGASY